MRHQVSGKKLNRNSKQRKALYKGLLAALITEGQIVTTSAKAKVTSRLIDKLITRAKKGDLNSRRIIAAFFNQKIVTNKLVDELAPALTARTSGYTKITRLGNRTGDDTMEVRIEFVDRVAVKAAPVKKSADQDKDKSAVKETKSKSISPIQRAAQKLTSRSSAGNMAHKPTAPRTTSK